MPEEKTFITTADLPAIRRKAPTFNSQDAPPVSTASVEAVPHDRTEPAEPPVTTTEVEAKADVPRPKTAKAKGK
jgi:hypothetical protein